MADSYECRQRGNCTDAVPSIRALRQIRLLARCLDGVLLRSLLMFGVSIVLHSAAPVGAGDASSGHEAAGSVPMAGGPSHAVEPFGRGVLLAVGSQLFVLALDGNGQLTAVGASEPLPAMITGIAVHELTAYLTYANDLPDPSWGGIAAVDLSDPTAPRIASVLETQGGMRDISVADDGTVYAVGDMGEDFLGHVRGAVVVVQSGAETLDTTAQVSFEYSLHGIAIDGDRMFVTEEGSDWVEPMLGLRELDISDRARPRKVQKSSLKGNPGGVTASGERVLVASKGAGLQVVTARPGEPFTDLERWDPRGCITEVVAGRYPLVLNPCAGKLSVLDSSGLVPMAEAGALDEVTDAAAVEEFVIAAKATGGAVVLIREGDAIRPVSEWTPSSASSASDPRPHDTGSRPVPERRSEPTLAMPDSASSPFRRASRPLKEPDAQVPPQPVFLPMVTTRTRGGGSPQLRLRARIGGGIRAIAAADDVVYAGEGSTLIVLNAVGSELEVVARGPDFGAPITDLQLVDYRLYAAVGEGGLAIFDVRNPMDIKLVGRTTTGDWAAAMDVLGTSAHVAASDAGLEVYEVADDSLRRLASADIAGRARRVLRTGDVAYVSSPGKPPTIVDLADPRAPEVLAWPESSDGPWHSDLFQFRQFLYGFPCDECIDVFDVTDPRLPVHIASVEDVIAPTWGLPVAVDDLGNRAFFPDYGIIREIDLIDPTGPRQIATSTVGVFGEIIDFALVEESLYAAYTTDYDGYDELSGFPVPAGGVLVYDALPCCTLRQEYQTPWSYSAIFPSDPAFPVKYMWRWRSVAEPPDVYTVDFSDPLVPVPGRAVGASLSPDIQLVGARGYQRSFAENVFGFEVFDLTDPFVPRSLPLFATPDRARLFPLQNDSALVTWPLSWPPAPSTAAVYDLSTQPPRQLGSLDLPGPLSHAVYDGALAHLVSYEHVGGESISTLTVTDMSNPSVLSVVGTVVLPENPHAIVLVGTNTLLASFDSGLAIIDTSVPPAPKLHELSIGRSFNKLTHVQDDWWLATGDGMVLYDMADPYNPRPMSALERVGYLAVAEAWEVVKHDGYLYLSAGTYEESGLTVVELMPQ
jgi:hypothetical protein